MGGFGTFPEITREDWEKAISVNLTGVFTVSSGIVPAMIEDNGGRIINIASMAGRNISYLGSASYTASKWGVIGLTKHMAWDLGEHGITVNAVCPGPTLTPLTKQNTSEELREDFNRKVPLNEWARPEDQANAVLYLASEDGRYVNGSVIDVDGGAYLGIRNEI